jgi:two-component system sensor kinase FixL
MQDILFAILAADDDAAIIERVLAANGLPASRASPAELASGIAASRWTAAFVGEEQLAGAGLAELKRVIAQQPPFTDFPVLMLIDRSAPRDPDHLAELGQLRLIERPIEPALILTAARSALRSRERQRDARAFFMEGHDAQDHLRELTDTLELRVRERMAELRTANEQLMREAEERLETEQRLRESEELYRYTVELSQQMAWTADAEHRILSVSPRFNVVTGIGTHVAPNDGWLAAVHPDDLKPVLCAWEAEAPTRGPRVAEFRMRVADGSYRLFRARAGPRLDGQGRPVGWYGYTEDIEDQRQAEIARREAEERLRESEELHRHTLELSQQIVWTASPDGTFLGRSRRFNELTGLAEDTTPSKAVHAEDIRPMLAAWRRSVATGLPFSADFRLRIRDGSYRHFRARAAARRDTRGNIVRWYGTSEDIGEQKRAEQARREAEERYQLAARATNDVIWDLNLVTDEIQWSDSASSFFGYAGGSEPTNLAWWEERIHPDDRQRVSDSLERAVRSGQSHWSDSYRFLDADHHYVDIYDRGFIIRDNAGRGTRAVGAMSDVSDRRHAEAQLQRMQAELIHVSRLSAMGTMASTLAHEINQPLTAVASYVHGSRRLLQDIDDPVVARVREALEAAEAGALRAGRIVRGLRELVARGNVSIKPEELPQLIHDAGVLAFVDAHLLGVSHRIELDPAAHWVDADRIQIQQVLINLVRNAVQAMTDQPTREVVISARPVAGEMVEISIADTGIGLTSEVREALFSPFRSTKAEGMGIGLSISRTIVEAHGGKIWAEDRDGGGTVFRFTVPLSEVPGSEAAEAAAAAE